MLEKALLTQAGDRSAWTLKLGATESGETSGSQAYAMVSDSCALARKHDVTNWADVVSLSVAAFLT